MNCSGQNLVTEFELAQRLGVSTRQVRKYLKNDNLPHIGNGKCRRFEWLKVLDWYLLYRVDISGTGGSQRDVLARRLSEIRNAAAIKAQAAATDACRRSFDRETVRLKLQIDELKRDREFSKRRQSTRRSQGC